MEYKPEVNDSDTESGNDLTSLLDKLQLQAQELDKKYRKSHDENVMQDHILNDVPNDRSDSYHSEGDNGSDYDNENEEMLAEQRRSFHALVRTVQNLAFNFDILTEEIRMDRSILEETRVKLENAEEHRDMLSENQNAIMDLRARQLQEYFEIATARMKKIEEMIKANALQPKQVSVQEPSRSVESNARSGPALLNAGSRNKVTVSGNSAVTLNPTIVVNPSHMLPNHRPIAQYNEPITINAVLGNGNVINASGNANVTIAPVIHINLPTASFLVTATVEADGTTRTTIVPASADDLCGSSSSSQHSFVSNAPITISGNNVARRG